MIEKDLHYFILKRNAVIVVSPEKKQNKIIDSFAHISGTSKHIREENKYFHTFQHWSLLIGKKKSQIIRFW